MFAIRKFLFSFFIVAAIFLFSNTDAFAQEVLINEFAAVTEGTSLDPDWVELYNSTDTPIDLSGWLLRDNTETNKVELGGLICSKNFRKFNFSNRLNDSGDTIRLFSLDGSLRDTVTYFSDLVPKHEKGKSTGRIPDGSSNWVVFGQPTPHDSECQISTPTPTSSLVPTSTPSLTPTSTPKPPTPTPKPTATYKINNVKDEDGEILSNVKVYVDGVYLHHYAPEVLTFCDGCQCDTYVKCNFGEHTIKLEKTGYNDWSETRVINPGDFYEVSPVMEISETTPSPTPTPTLKLTPTPTKNTPTPKPVKLTATIGGEILGEEESSPGAFYPWEATEEAEVNQESTPSSQSKLPAAIFLGVGFLLLFATAFWVWYTRFR